MNINIPKNGNWGKNIKILIKIIKNAKSYK